MKSSDYLQICNLLSQNWLNLISNVGIVEKLKFPEFDVNISNGCKVIKYGRGPLKFSHIKRQSVFK